MLLVLLVLLVLLILGAGSTAQRQEPAPQPWLAAALQTQPVLAELQALADAEPSLPTWESVLGSRMVHRGCTIPV